ncbi:SOS response-associated peptidase [Papillibacter cinnamivorans]|uniref:Abasic site processing protein n=1 Tax=Papillibacter cinnamivorans DSM 12816 TaxID=1122930 RepID=A0A1W1ZJ08_9FIRM|nr:SOS response-associated peptidase [Papillibacter cinnamivorans]SMC48367.1 Putative SOS response-associated peptidase YedK [Papillibacter cinnamivorans DSM 12816]
MCGRYILPADRDIQEIREILDEINRKYKDTRVSLGEIYPTNTAPVLLSGAEGDLSPRPMTWGFPQWKGPGVIINARSETALQKPTFRRAFLSRRCVVPSAGFFEWSKKEGAPKKEKYLFTLPGEPMLYMAGLYDESPEGLPRFVILTTAANPSVAEIHSRMPVVLRKSELPSWTQNLQTASEYLTRVPPALTRQNAG